MPPHLISLIHETLAFYADKENYRSPSTGFAAQYDPEPSLMRKDNQGDRARRALEAVHEWANQ